MRPATRQGSRIRIIVGRVTEIWTSIPSAPAFWRPRWLNTTVPERGLRAEQTADVSCFVDDLMVGVDVEAVQEVTCGAELTHVPLAAPVVSGLLNLRGRIVTAVDLRRWLQLPGRPADQPPINLILRADDGASACRWTRSAMWWTWTRTTSKHLLEHCGAALRELVTGAYKLDRGLLLVLDTERIVEESHVE